MNRDHRVAILLTGIGIGAAAGLLLAQCSGGELRKAIGKRANKAGRYLRDRQEEIADRVGETASDLSNKAKDIVDGTSDLVAKAGEELKASSRILTRKAEKLIDQLG